MERKSEGKSEWKGKGIGKGTGREMEGEKLVNRIKESESCRIRKIIGKGKGMVTVS